MCPTEWLTVWLLVFARQLVYGEDATAAVEDDDNDSDSDEDFFRPRRVAPADRQIGKSTVAFLFCYLCLFACETSFARIVCESSVSKVLMSPLADS